MTSYVAPRPGAPTPGAAPLEDPPVAPALSRPPLLGMALFIASESIFFLAIVVAFIALRPAGLAVAKVELDLPRTLIFSLCLFASSGTMTIAERRRRRDGWIWLLVTAGLGAVFLIGQGLEYARLLGTGISPRAGMFGTTFFTLTGLHGLHVLVGLTAISGLVLAARARPGGVRATAWESVAWYWHFVDGVWVVVFSVVYLGTVLG
ncbi:MAG TPA: cytochrome c oxidase subunit 3 [Candidatus Limnocylindria bacterium]|nr:cytochrome c oxidase subunit 3 [Candidatus Limnocylindria bacterium]